MSKLTKNVAKKVLKELRKPNPNLQDIEDILLGYEFPDVSGIQGPTNPTVRVSYGNIYARAYGCVALESPDESDVYRYGPEDLIKIFEVLS